MLILQVKTGLMPESGQIWLLATTGKNAKIALRTP